jgi:hypothetical protein
MEIAATQAIATRVNSLESDAGWVTFQKTILGTLSTDRTDACAVSVALFHHISGGKVLCSAWAKHCRNFRSSRESKKRQPNTQLRAHGMSIVDKQVGEEK